MSADPLPAGGSMRGRIRKFLRQVVVATVVAVQLGAVTVGIWWTVANIGKIPHYGDTTEYLRLTNYMRVDEYRGIAYPALLHLVDRLRSSKHAIWQVKWEPKVWARLVPCAAPPVLVVVQVFQLAISALAIAYCVWVFRNSRAGDGPRDAPPGGAWLLGALVFFDPLVAHFNLTVLTDGLALSATLVFCAALWDLASRQGRLWPIVALLLAAQLAAANLRTEKNLVLLATSMATALIWLALAWRKRTSAARRLRSRALLIAVCAFVGCGATAAIQSAYYMDFGRWSSRTAFLHSRIIFPHLTEIYDRLPEEVRARIPPRDVAIYDRGVHDMTTVVERALGKKREVRQRLTRTMAAVAWQERWRWILGDVMSDTAENIFAPVSYYARLAHWLRFPRLYPAGVSSWAAWTYDNLSYHLPWLSQKFVAAGALAFVVALPLAAVRGVQVIGQRRRRWWRNEPTDLAPLVPPVVLVAINSFGFAAGGGVLHIRYALISYALWLFLVYGSAIDWMRLPHLGDRREGEAGETQRSPQHAV